MSSPQVSPAKPPHEPPAGCAQAPSWRTLVPAMAAKHELSWVWPSQPQTGRSSRMQASGSGWQTPIWSAAPQVASWSNWQYSSSPQVRPASPPQGCETGASHTSTLSAQQSPNPAQRSSHQQLPSGDGPSQSVAAQLPTESALPSGWRSAGSDSAPGLHAAKRRREAMIWMRGVMGASFDSDGLNEDPCTPPAHS